MDGFLIRNKIPKISSYLIKSQNHSLIFKKITDEKSYKCNSDFKKNSSIDYEDFGYNQKSNFIRKLSKSGHINQRTGNFEKYMSNIRSSENIYKDMPIRNAPSFHRNLSEIHDMIRGRKYKNIKLLDNIFFNSGFSNDNMDDFHDFQQFRKNDVSLRYKKSKLRPIQRNNSCEELIDVSNKFKKLIKNDETQQLSTNFSKAVNIKNNNSKILIDRISIKNLKNNTSNFSTTTNKSLITSKLPEFQSNSNSNSNICINEEFSIDSNKNNISSLPKLQMSKVKKTIIPQLSSHDSSVFESEKLDLESPKKESTFITNLNTDKMRFNINKLLLENHRGKEKIDVFEEKILKMKIFQIYQKESLEKYLNDERFSVQERIDHIIKMYKIYENIYKEYSSDLTRYINFLFKISNEMDLEKRVTSKKKKDLTYEIEVLVDKLINKQKELEYLINTRNFIFWVKNKDNNIINMNNQYVYRVSKRIKLVNDLFDILGTSTDSFAYKYLKKIIPLEQLEKIIIRKQRRSRASTKKKSTLRQTTSLTNTNSITNLTEKMGEELSPPSPGEKIFDSPDDFLKVLDNLKNNGIALLKEYEQSQKEKGNLLSELNQSNNLYEKYEKSFKYNYINILHKKLELEKQKFLKMSKKSAYIKNLMSNKQDLSSLKTDFKIISFNAFSNIYFYNLIKYNKLRIKYKYAGLVLYEKIQNNINYIFSENEKLNLFDSNEVDNYIPQAILNQILMTKKENINENNEQLIKPYTLKLIKLFGFFYEIIINKNNESKKSNPDLYKQLRDQVQRERKIHNTKIIKKMLDEKRDNANKKLMEKWNKKTVLETRKLDLEISSNYNKDIKEEIIAEKIENEEKEDEYKKYNLLVDDEI